jgi:hypothetical protein
MYVCSRKIGIASSQAQAMPYTPDHVTNQLNRMTNNYSDYAGILSSGFDATAPRAENIINCVCSGRDFPQFFCEKIGVFLEKPM